MKDVAPTGSLKDAVNATQIRVTEVMPTGKSLVVNVSSAADLKQFELKLGRSCHVVERTKGRVL
jgi:hypothetical protein